MSEESNSDTDMDLLDVIRAHAERLGFTVLGVAPAGPRPTWPAYARWLGDGHAGEMGYMSHRRNERRDVRNVWSETRSVVALAVNYRPPVEKPDPPPPNAGIVSSYAWGGDYHDLCWRRLDDLARVVKEATGIEARGYVDTGPILERDVAAEAGLGWIGKNTMLIHPARGSWFFLAELLVAADLPATAERVPDRCGTCTRCLDACPTRAFAGPYVLDARRCISYLTIELKGPIPRELRPLVGAHVFGCDVCQDVCPWNRDAPATDEPAFQPRGDLLAPDLVPFLALSEAEFRGKFAGSPILRAKRRGFLRNVCAALGNVGNADAIPALERALADTEPLVRMHAGWALMRIAGRDAVTALEMAVERETDGVARADLGESVREAKENPRRRELPIA